MLDYCEFKTVVVDSILDYLPNDYEECEVSIETVLKCNGQKLDGLLIRDARNNITPNIYLQSYYQDYVGGKSVEKVLEDIASCRIKTSIKSEVAPRELLDFEKIKDCIFIMLVNTERNEDMLRGRPHKDFMDLTMIYFIDIRDCVPTSKFSGNMSVGITNRLAEYYGLDIDELHELAMKNMKRIVEVKIDYLFSAVMDMVEERLEDGSISEEEAQEMYSRLPDERSCQFMYMTNQTKNRAASLITRQDLLERIGVILGGDYYILPSSIHEVILVSVESGFDEERLFEMVRETNNCAVSNEDFLSNNIYYFDSQNKEISMIQND